MRLRPRSRPSDDERAAARALALADAAEEEIVRLREALDALPVGMVVCDQTGREVVRSRRAVALFGDLQTDVLVARTLTELVAAARVGGRQVQTLELTGPPARSVQLTAERLASGGAVAVVEDTSERRQLDAVRRDFVANVNHELRTPIGALGVLAEALAEETDVEVVHRLAARISVEVDRARTLIEDLLELGRLEVRLAERRDELHLDAVVRAAVERVVPLAGRHGVRVEVDRCAPGVSVEADEDQLVSAVANLLDNAVKYSDPGTSVVVECCAGDEWAEVSVRDEGIGIPAKDLDRIFERFYRVDRARDRRTGGTGLGLAIVRHVAANHGGEVAVDSREGEGSTFTLRLPRTQGR